MSVRKSGTSYSFLFQAQKKNLINNEGKKIFCYSNITCLFLGLFFCCCYFYFCFHMYSSSFLLIDYFLCFENVNKKHPLLSIVHRSHFSPYWLSVFESAIFLLCIISFPSNNKPLRILSCIQVRYFGVFNEIEHHSSLHCASCNYLFLWKST